MDGTANLTGTITTSSFIDNSARGIQIINQGSGNTDVDIGQAGVANSGGTFTDNGIAVDIDLNGSGSLNFNVLNASFTTANYATIFGAGGAGSPSTSIGAAPQARWNAARSPETSATTRSTTATPERVLALA